MTFRPYPGFTIFTVISVVLLCGLGVWQVQRLHWKLDLIARIQHGLATPAQPIGLVWRQALAGTPGGLESGLDYRKVVVTGHFSGERPIYFFATGADGRPEYHMLVPFIARGNLAAGDLTRTGSDRLLVDRGRMPSAFAVGGEVPAVPQGEQPLVGVLRQPSAPNWFTPKPDLTKRITYTRDPRSIAAAFGMKPLLPVFLEADATPNPGGWPKGGQTVVDLPNNHLSYAATWFGLAFGLLGVWLAYHIQKGRLAWGKR